ncbi:catechol 2,3-dioxygenase-like lactoylglutathione lyase family enzyme [Allocatelliglobosispora scoriae]|uniref:Catechol 2,3-dioxygenase-like lactoylglutathione lyase family enzyme n=1 Tax=Allocatelliglobosispora scoriae TaxID=643052 RepID=A0A841C193_9ACTN|nr:VOC family protein [Allocatelliglobosispora scoriae]MBB5872913.1 catechol 2,3-dioxygenase-like lactoylglutathione lyase family enzyme [Allocatelliglobosispora scoriae]
MSAAALWAPLEVPEFAGAAEFYGEVLGLPRIDEWSSEDERGAVFGVGEGGRIEVVQTGTPSSPPGVAIELPSRAAVDALHETITAMEQLLKSCGDLGPAVVFPRGHYGFVVRDPAGNAVLIWSEARS